MTELEIKRVLFAALFILGPKGEYWIKAGPSIDQNIHTKYCILSAVSEGAKRLNYPSSARGIVHDYLRVVLKDLGYPHYSPVAFNDDPNTTWDNVKELFTVAIDRIKPLI